jgi:putative ABC transport system ATP-binding protein
MTIPVATHDPLVNSRCDRIVRLRDGRVVEEMDSAPGASPPDVLARISCLDMGR